MDISDLDLIRKSDLFDAEWYQDQYPDVKILGMDPAEHYLKYGFELGRKPSMNFDLSDLPDENSGSIKSKRNPLVAYLRSQTFSTKKTVDSVTEPNGKANQKPPLDKVVPVEKKMRQEDRVKRNTRHSGGADYALLAEHFDEEFYLRRYQDIARATIDPALHYLNNGGKELRFPSPDFDPKYYVKRYSDVEPAKTNPFLHYLKIGKSEGRSPSALSAGNPHYDRFASMLELAPEALQARIAEKKQDVRARLISGELGEMVARAANLDPLINHSWIEALRPGVSPIRSEQLTQQMSAMYELQTQAEWKRAKIAVLIPWVHVSGAARVAGFLTTALASLYGADEVVVIRTETSEFQFPEWFPPECRQIDFSAEAKGLSENARERLLVEFLRSLRLDHIFNVNSRTFWGVLNSYGTPLSKSVSLHTYLFCNEKNLYGDWVGYPVRNYHKFAALFESIICDSHFLRTELLDRFVVPADQAEKMVVMNTPINSLIGPKTRTPRRRGSRPKVYWAGRFDRQKRIDIAFAIAEQMPDVDFHFWGKPRLDRNFEKLTVPKNVVLEGLYKDFEDLPLEQCDAWLYTAEWDGVPTILLDVASAALPLVGSIAGGTGEVLMEGLTEPVHEIESVEAYVAGLRRAINDPQSAKQKALELRDIIVEKRSDEAYLDALRNLLEMAASNE